MKLYLGSNIKALRKKHQLTLPELAKLIKIQRRQTISDYEHNKSNPRLKTLIRLADVFNVSLKNLLFKNYAGYR